MRRTATAFSWLLLGALLLLQHQAAHAFAPGGAPSLFSRGGLQQQKQQQKQQRIGQQQQDVNHHHRMPPTALEQLQLLGATAGGGAGEQEEGAAAGGLRRGPLAAWVGRVMRAGGGRGRGGAEGQGARQRQRRAVAPLRASLTPEQEAKRYQIQRQVQELDELIQAKAEAKRALDKDIEALLAQKRGLQLEVNTLAPSLELASESPLRSLVKACSWRFIAALITLSTSLFFSRDAKMAASIVSSDFLSKAGTMYIGERLWNKVDWGKEAKAGDAASRSIMKAFAWRAFAMVNTLIISIIFAKNVKVAGQIASTDTIVKTSLYIVHERVWAKIDWGRRYDVEYQI